MELLSGLMILGPMTLGFLIVEKINLGSSILPTAEVSSRHHNASAGGHPRPLDPAVVNIDHRTENPPATGPTALPPCHQAGALGLSRIVQIDTNGGPEFGWQHLKGYDFLRDREVVLTFDDGPWPGSTPAVLKALADQCARATFFEIGEHASWHPEITRQVVETGMTVGTHTWSHKDLARGPYARDLEKAKQEIELGNSAVHEAAAGGDVAPFFRFPDLQHPSRILSYFAERQIAIFSTDIDSRDFALHRPEEVVRSVMSQLEKRGKGIVLLHDLHSNTAAAMPELLRQIKAADFKVVHMVPKVQLSTIAKYDQMVSHSHRMSSNNGQAEDRIIRTLSE